MTLEALADVDAGRVVDDRPSRLGGRSGSGNRRRLDAARLDVKAHDDLARLYAFLAKKTRGRARCGAWPRPRHGF